MKAGARAVFLDRDGVINADPGAALYVRRWPSFRFLKGVFEGLRALDRAGYKIFVVSNQSGIARGLVKKEDLQEMTENMRRSIEAEGVKLGGIYYCLHDDGDGCACRKPKAGLYETALAEAPFDRVSSFNVGDTERDIEAGRMFGLKSVLVLSGKTARAAAEEFFWKPDAIVENLKEAAQWIIKQKGF